MLQASAAGGGGQTIDVGYLPTTDAPTKPANATVGTNPVHGYTLDPLYSWSINYFPVNFQSTTGNGPILKQLYFREALAYLVNQQADHPGPAARLRQVHGRAGRHLPVDPVPVGRRASRATRSRTTRPRPSSLLTSHGWKVVPNGVTTCDDAVAVRRRASSRARRSASPCRTRPGTDWIASEMTQLQSNASTVGIKLSLDPKPFNQVTAIAGGNCVIAHISCDWDMANWGGGWTFVPDYYPTGETLFLTGSGRELLRLHQRAERLVINQTLTSTSMQSLYTWQDYLASSYRRSGSRTASTS